MKFKKADDFGHAINNSAKSWSNCGWKRPTSKGWPWAPLGGLGLFMLIGGICLKNLEAPKEDKAKATESEKFKTLLETLEKYNQRYVSAVLSVTGALLIVIGWLLNAANVKSLFATSLPATLIVIFITIPLIYAYWFSMLRVYRVNHDAYASLNMLDYMEEKYYSHHLLPRKYLLLGIGINVWHYIFIAGLVANHHWGFLTKTQYIIVV